MKHQIVLVVNRGDDVVMIGQVFFGVSDTYGTNPRPIPISYIPLGLVGYAICPSVSESRIITI